MKAGAGALSARLRCCRVPVGEVNDELFMKLMETMVWCFMEQRCGDVAGNWNRQRKCIYMQPGSSWE